MSNILMSTKRPRKETQGGKNHVSLGAGAEKETESASAEILVSKFVVVLTTS